MVPLSYSYRNLIVRWRTTLMTASGFTLVVTALIVMLAFVNGVRTVCAGSGQPENVVVMKEGNFDEVLSQLESRLAFQIEAIPHVARDAHGRPLSSRELFMAVTQWDERSGKYHQVQIRGVYPVAREVHSQVKIVRGRMFRRNRREIVLGAGMARQQDLDVGDTLPLGQEAWEVVGVFTAAGSAFESEAWCDLDQLAGLFRREGIYSSVILRTASPAAAARAVDYLEDNRALAVQAQTETDYYRQQAEQTDMIRAGAVVVSVFMAIGAVFGVMNTMFAAIAERVKDIAVMRLLGFRRMEILASFLLESLLIASFGGAVGTLLGYAVNGLTLSTALGAKSIAFAFTVDGPILAIGAIFSLAMGVVGGLLPALSAMRIAPLEAMR